MNSKKDFIVLVILLLGIFSFALVANAKPTNIKQAFAGGTGTASDPYQITDCTQLQNMSLDLSGNYELMNDIDCSDTKNWNNGTGFVPIGDRDTITPFTGAFDGNNHKIYSLYINLPGANSVGLFGYTTGTVANIGLVNAYVSNLSDTNKGTGVGVLAGYDTGTITNSYSTGRVSGYNWVGGLVGGVDLQGSITDSHSSAAITVRKYGALSGGLVGYINTPATVSTSYATGSVNGYDYAGGLAGMSYGTITNSYATGNVVGHAWAGGLVGANFGGGTGHAVGAVSNSYATGSINANSYIGGLVGGSGGGSISNCYATGFNYGKPGAETGGLIGSNVGGNAIIQNSYYDTNTTGQKDTGKGIPKTTAQMMQQSTFSSWDFANTWKITNNIDYPRLVWQKVTLKVGFMPIMSQVKVKVPFPVIILANDNTYNDRVYLHSARGAIDPGYVDLVNGSWTGLVTLYSVGENNHLIVNYDYPGDTGGDTNTSNNFEVTGQNGVLPQDAELIGNLTNDDGDVINGAKVSLYSGDPRKGGTIVGQPIYTDSNGNYSFTNFVPGRFYLKAQYSGYQATIEEIDLASQRTVTSKLTLDTVCPAGETGRVPVLLVPGIMGSNSTDNNFSPYPRLPKDPPIWDQGKIRIFDPGKNLGGVAGWKQLKNILKSKPNGYISGCTLFKVPYDWSLPVTEIRDKYLIPWIEQARKKSGSNEVDIIAHSMGGLVVRSYLQSPQYIADASLGKKVRKFAIVGTPSKGADLAYYLWEGGNPIAADRATNGITGPAKYFYSKTLNRLYKRKGKASGKLCDTKGKDPLCDYNSVYGFLHDQVRSVRTLMPIYAQALLNVKDGKNVPIIYEENTFLMNLNNLPCLNGANGLCFDVDHNLYSFSPPQSVLSRDSSEVQTKLFIGNERPTTQWLVVQPQPVNYIGKLYKDGLPAKLAIPILKGMGDKTVPKISADFNDYLHLPKDKELLVDLKPEEHKSLINGFKEDIVKFITGSEYRLLPAISDNNPQTGLIVNIYGRAKPSIADIVSLNDKQKITNPPNEQDSLHLEFSGFELKNPINGQYTISLQSPYNEDYEMVVRYYDENKDIYISKEVKGYYDPTLRSFTVNINKENTTDPVTFDRAFDAPINLKMLNGGNKILLTWQDPTGVADKDVLFYQIYWKRDYEPYFKYLGSSNINAYPTNQNWTEADTNIYVVRAILKNGTSTFFSSPTFSP